MPKQKESKPIEVTFELECPSCKASGVYWDSRWPKHIGLECADCDGEGSKVVTISGKTFSGKKPIRKGIREVRAAFGGQCHPVTVKEYKAGKRPEQIYND